MPTLWYMLNDPWQQRKKYDDNLNIVYDPGSSCMDCMTIAAIPNSDQICYTSLSRMMMMMMMIVVFDNDQCHTYLKMHLSFSMSSTIIFQRKKKRERGDSYYRYTFWTQVDDKIYISHQRQSIFAMILSYILSINSLSLSLSLLMMFEYSSVGQMMISSCFKISWNDTCHLLAYWFAVMFVREKN